MKALWWAPMVAAAIAVVIVVPTQGVGPNAGQWLAVAATAIALRLVALQVRRQGVLLMAAALALAVSQVAGPTDGGSLIRMLAMGALPLVAALAGVSLSGASGATVAVAVGALLAGPVRLAFYDPLLDPGCLPCLSTPTIHEDQRVATMLAFVGALLVAGGLAWSARSSSVKPLAWLLAGAAAIGVFTREPPNALGSEAAWFAAALAIAGGLLTLARLTFQRRRLRLLSEALSSGLGAEQSLRAATGDPSVALAYSTAFGWVDAVGRPASGAVPGQVTTEIGHTRIHHRNDHGRTDLLAQSLTPELRLGIEHARLSAVLAAQVRELRSSRERLVEHADAERRLLERDLHDGAQQHLLAFGFDLRRAITVSDPADRGALEACLAETASALEQLRVVARGVYPSLLSNAGLRSSLESLARQYDGRVVLGEMPRGRLPAAVQRTVYLLVSELAEVPRLDVRGELDGETLTIEVTGALLGSGSIIRERVATLGGTVSCVSDTTTVRLPCG